MTPPSAQPLAVELDVNGHRRTVAVEPDRTLLDVLREDIGLTGTKGVCEMGDCGACTVLVDDRAVCSCLVLAVEIEDQRVETIEGVATGQELSAVQRAFVECDALQCGFCTPGQVMSLEGLARRDFAPDDDVIESTVLGNLCRCGAYRHILEAARKALGTPEDADEATP